MNSSLSKKSFGALIRKFRLKNGYTQQQLALKIGIQTKSISFIERGINYPSPENIFKLAQVLNISLDEYIFGYCKYMQYSADHFHYYNRISKLFLLH